MVPWPRALAKEGRDTLKKRVVERVLVSTVPSYFANCTLIPRNHQMKTLILLFSLLISFPALATTAKLTDCKASQPQSVTTGGTDQVQLTSNGQRNTFWIENYCSATSQGIVTAESLWVNFGAAASVGTGFEISTCGTNVFLSNYPVQQDLHIYAATTGHQFACKWSQ